ncbi:hormone-sensitive lipase isoform X2 [Suricata suricatta]|uniref:hormone-sensitive lipase isoform X2 n=1 Tax=Suricata suricatta TaxID=37032 RepID=UPI001155ADE4|nr:hormone-sensitive lipase isoform X2 [Suricata suricatta]
MKPGKSISPEREITTAEPGSKSGSSPDWEPKPPQTPITQPEPEPKATATAQPESKTHQEPGTEQDPAPQQRPLTQQEPLAQREAEAQQEPGNQQNSALQRELFAPQEPVPQQSPPIHRVPFTEQQAASQQGPGPRKESETQQEAKLRDPHVAEPGPAPVEQQEAGSTPPAQPTPGPQNEAPVHTESTTQETPKQSDPTDQQTAPAQGARSPDRFSNDWGFLSKLHQLPTQQPASEWRTFFDWITDSDFASDLGAPVQSNLPAKTYGPVAQEMKLTFKGKHEVASGYGGKSAHGKNPRHYSDSETLANGYRSLVHTARCCLAHLLHKSRYVASNRRSIFFRTSHNLAELEAYLAALTQLRALAYYAQRLLATNQPGKLFFEGDEGLITDFLHEYVTLHKGCFYGRCLGFQFTPAIRPFLQTISIGLVSFGEHYKRNETGLGVTASSLFTSGRFAIDPELRGAEFERIIQNLDVHFWKAFWNITEIEVLSSLANMASTTVRVSRLLSLPPEAFEMPLTADPKLTVTISPPLAHTGPGPVLVRLISYELREGQDSEELSSLVKSEGPRSLELRPRPQQAPRSQSLVVHIHGGGFVAQTSKSHEPYLKSWAQELGTPILSIDYSLAPEAPFPRALEECFYAYCWAVKHCALLGSTGERICLAGDSAGGNLCFSVSLRAAAYGVRVPDGIMAAYPATMLQSTASPSRLLSLMDPLLPLSVLTKCVSAYAGGETEDHSDPSQKALGMMGLVRRDTALLFRDLRLGASSWLHSFLDLGGHKSHTNSVPMAEPMRRSVSEAALAQPEGPLGTDSLKSLTLHDLSLKGCSDTSGSPELSLSAETLGPSTPSNVNFLAGPDDAPQGATAPQELSAKDRGLGVHATFPEGFHPRRSSQGPTRMPIYSSPIVKNPFMSPLLAPDSMLQSLPPVHIVACALDPMLDDSVMFARRLRGLGKPVTLCVVEDLPHGFLSLAPLCRETRQAAAQCVERIRLILAAPAAPRV